jgi:alpha-N-arabinofuranosidase
METVARSKSVWGPFEPCPRNPILTNRHLQRETWQGVGHADRGVDPNGKERLVLHGYRYAREFFHPLGREALLAPLTWDEDGWPRVFEDGTLRGDVPVTGLPDHPWEKDSTDPFSVARLGPEWTSLRGRDPLRCRLDRRPGCLSQNGGSLSLEKSAVPATVFQRQRHFEFFAEVTLDFASKGVAGMTVFYDQEHHYDLRVFGGTSGHRIELYQRIGDLGVVTQTHDLPAGPVRMQVEGDRRKYTFRYRLPKERSWREMGTARLEYVCTEATPVSFTGVMVGLFCESPKSGDGWADFSGFTYQPA